MKSKHIVYCVIISISLFYISAQICRAQIVLSTNDLPVAGKLQVSVKANPVQGESILPGLAGANINWDFRDLKPCCGTLAESTDTVAWESHNATGNPGFFPLSNIAMRNRCFTFHSHISHVDETQCYFSHYIKNAAGLWRYGMEEPANFLFDSNWNIFPLLAYGESFDTSAEFHVPVSDDTVRVYHILSKAIADGWGVISTPDTTADVIRIYTTEVVYDSLFVNGTLKKSDVYQGNYYYRWYAKNLGFPVLEIARGMQSQQPPFRQEVRFSYHKSYTLSAPRIEVSEKIKVYPNPFSSTIDLDFGENFSNASFSLFDATGKTTLKKANVQSGSRIPTDGLAPGMYFYEIVSPQQQVFRGKLLKNNN